MRKKKILPIIRGPMSPVTCKLPDAVVDYLDARAARQLRTRSDLVRHLVVEALRTQGVVASEADMDEAAA